MGCTRLGEYVVGLSPGGGHCGPAIAEESSAHAAAAQMVRAPPEATLLFTSMCPPTPPGSTRCTLRPWCVRCVLALPGLHCMHFAILEARPAHPPLPLVLPLRLARRRATATCAPMPSPPPRRPRPCRHRRHRPKPSRCLPTNRALQTYMCLHSVMGELFRPKASPIFSAIIMIPQLSLHCLKFYCKSLLSQRYRQSGLPGQRRRVAQPHAALWPRAAVAHVGAGRGVQRQPALHASLQLRHQLLLHRHLVPRPAHSRAWVGMWRGGVGRRQGWGAGKVAWQTGNQQQQQQQASVCASRLHCVH